MRFGLVVAVAVVIISFANAVLHLFCLCRGILADWLLQAKSRCCSSNRDSAALCVGGWLMSQPGGDESMECNDLGLLQ